MIWHVVLRFCKYFRLILFFLILVVFLGHGRFFAQTTESQPKAGSGQINWSGRHVVPGLQGFGTSTPAGRGGQIMKVTNLNDSGAGSLRAAIEATGPRIIVFEVSGTITLASDLFIRNPYITIAGQTAPSPGILLRGGAIQIYTQHVLIQHIRIRTGDAPAGPNPINRDALGLVGSNVNNVVIDHISASWGVDENASLWGAMRDITISNSIISEGLSNSIHPKGEHSKGLLIGGGTTKNISFIGNLLAHNRERNPRVNGGTSLIVLNNVMYNAGQYEFMGIGGDLTAGPSAITAIGNSFISGPNTSSTIKAISMGTANAAGSQLHLSDNLLNGRLYNLTSQWIVSTRPTWLSDLTVYPSSEVEGWVLVNAGARPADRDEVDKRVVNEVKTRTGSFVDSPGQVGGWPNLPQNYRAFVLPPNPNGDDDGDGYTNVEELLNQMAMQVEGR